MTKQATYLDHDDVQMQIPWYLNGTLTETEATLVRKHLENCSDCRADVAVHERMRRAVVQDEATPIVPSVTAASLLDNLERPVPRAASWSRYRNYAVAASLVISVVVATVVLTTRFSPAPKNQTFQTATGEQTNTGIAYVLQLQFEDGTSPETRRRILDELGATDVRTSGETRAYEMLIRMPNSSLGELETFARKAQARSEVRNAEFIALQMPVR
jgi:ferric-dicitrate binding protein FerR (iron transport regulator)